MIRAMLHFPIAFFQKFFAERDGERSLRAFGQFLQEQAQGSGLAFVAQGGGGIDEPTAEEFTIGSLQHGTDLCLDIGRERGGHRHTGRFQITSQSEDLLRAQPKRGYDDERFDDVHIFIRRVSRADAPGSVTI